MGSCAGVGNPQRKYRSAEQTKNNRNNSLKKESESKLPNKNQDSAQRIIESSLSLGFEKKKSFREEDRLKKSNTMNSNITQPWKNKVIGRTISKYIKPATLKEQQQKSKSNTHIGSKQNIMSFAQVSLAPKRTIGEQSLQNEIKELKKNENYQNIRYNGSEMSSEMKEMFGNIGEKKNEGNNKFDLYYEDESEEQRPKKFMTFSSPVNKMEISVFSDKFDVFDNSPPRKAQYPIHYYESNEERASSKYYGGLSLKRTVKQKNEQQLNMINQIFQKQTETPNYVRGMKMQFGQDIRYDTIGKQIELPNVLTDEMSTNINKYLSILKN